jgi:tripartite-type tricarboxylate transporter receptor subunit TctC
MLAEAHVKTSMRGLVALGLFAGTALQWAPAAAADTFPRRPVRIIAPFPPGGGVDITARILADPLGQALGQTIVVDNRPGAGGRLGIELVARAEPDGYTLGLSGIGMAIQRALYQKLPYDTLRDFIPISTLTEQPNILVAHPSIAARSLQDLIALARSQPGALTYASPGVGTGNHLAMELLLMSQKATMLHVPYKGTAPALSALLSNETAVYHSTYASALPHVKSERLRAFGVTGAKRTKTLPEVPTISESGAPGNEYATWYGLVAPAGVRGEIIDRLNKATVAALNRPAIRQLCESQGLDPIPSTAAHYAAYLKSETDKWTVAARAAKIDLER